MRRSAAIEFLENTHLLVEIKVQLDRCDEMIKNSSLFIEGDRK